MLLVHFSLRQDGKSKTPSAYKFTTITQQISNLPNNTMDSALQMKLNDCRLRTEMEAWDLRC